MFKSALKISLSNAFLLSMIVTTAFSSTVIAYFWISSTYSDFEIESEVLKRRYIDDQKANLKSEVRSAVDYIEFKRSQTESRLKEGIKLRTFEAHAIALNIYEQNKKRRSRKEIEKMVRDALRPIRFNNGTGYYFATRLNGVEELFADRPELEGKDLLDMQDTNGKFVIKGMIALVKEKGEGFYQYTWTKPNVKGKDFPKIAFIKYFAPFDWLIGTGEYLDDIEKGIQKEVLQRLSVIRFGKDGYIFAGQWDGLSLTGPADATGKNMWDVVDSNGVKIVQELIAAAKKGEGFVSYVLPRFEGKKSAPKLSYAIGIREWQWYVGGGIYVDEIDQLIETNRSKLKAETRSQVIKISVILFCLFIVVLIIARVFSRWSKTSFDLFSSFFQRATTASVQLKEEELNFSEFALLAKSANKMISDRKIAEDQLSSLRNLLSNIINSMPSILAAVDLQGKVTEWNKEAENETGISNADAQGRLLSELLPQFAEGITNLKNTIQSREPIVKEKFQIQKAEKLQYWDILIYPLITENREGAVVRIEDSTNRVRMEQTMIQTEKMMSVGGLAAGMAHEINNPLGGILQGIQNLTRRLTPSLEKNREAAEKCGIDLEKVQEYLEERSIPRILKGIQQASEKAAAIIRNMLHFSRQSDSKFEHVDIAKLIDQAIELAKTDYNIKEKFDFRHIQISKEYDPQMREVPCSDNEMEQVIFNILKNAAQAMADDAGSSPKISIRTRIEDEQAVIEIEDNGPGMEETVRKRLFEPFFTTKSVGEGTGLGLSIAYMIVTNNHQGTIEVVSTKNSGTCFIIHLPL
jgi:two-component system, NtrC family, sensor kinase